MRTVKQVRGLRIRLGGAEHSGWLPAGAAPPPPTPVREAVLDVRIEETDGGYLLICHSRNTPDSGDRWHETIEDAEAKARDAFGLEPGDWQDAPIG